jgi:hypothetical protein
MKSIVEVQKLLYYTLVQNLQTPYIFFDKRLKLFSTGSKNQKWSDGNAIVYSLLKLQSVFIYLFILSQNVEINSPCRKENYQWKTAWIPVTSVRDAMLKLTLYR